MTRSQKLRRKSTRRSRRNVQNGLQKGGVKIGEGQYGMAFRPPLRCADDAHADKMNEAFVGKILQRTRGELEVANGQIILGIDAGGQWSAPCTVSCAVADGEGAADIAAFRASHANIGDEPLIQIIAPYAGRSLLGLFVDEGVAYDENMFNNPAQFANLRPSQLDIVIGLVKSFLPTVKRLNREYLHSDLHLGNLAWDGSRVRMIDFGEMEKIDSVVERKMVDWSRVFENYEGMDEESAQMVQEILVEKVRSEITVADVANLYGSLYKVLTSRWVTETFGGRFTEWKARVTADEAKYYNDYVLRIVTIP